MINQPTEVSSIEFCPLALHGSWTQFYILHKVKFIKKKKKNSNLDILNNAMFRPLLLSATRFQIIYYFKIGDNS